MFSILISSFSIQATTYGHLFLTWHVTYVLKMRKCASVSYLPSLLAGGNGAGMYKQRSDPTTRSQEGC